ncbi:two-component system sensor histidine kinase RppB [Chamaesiphon polymorphus]|uniref:histidine kinase n=1 Tax=Chamaesiphon polymorphus CCALA 037 TaxID=2107692 RepID=A0A2T1GCL6_9CYAN|nr:two-component system sensor histidine kinase RppB [Chamaesiphon polymorphus]PSB55048.1 two-component sensor histidine kinase [Chamaesiphon polymorphus CCALA 037]
MHQNRLFNRTRIQLTFTYALVIGLITLLSGSAIHLVMIRAFARTVDRELNTLAGTVHDALEAVLQQPEIVNSVVMNVLPGLCVVGKECSPVKPHSKIAELTKKQGYCLRLLNLKGQTIATLGSTQHKFTGSFALPRENKIPTMDWETITDDRGERYHFHTLPLKTIDNRDWGYLQVAQSFDRLDEYMSSLHLILIFGIPLAMLLIGGASWWLSGLAIEPIYQSYQQIQQFTADAAHELRTPLAVTSIAVENALDVEVIEPETRTNWEIAQRQVRHLTRLAEDLLWLSRLEAKQSPMQFQTCCLNDLVSDLEEELAPLASSLAEPLEKRIDLRLEILTKQPIYVMGDSDRLYRAIANLIHNAIQYTPTAGVVTIRLESSERHAIITIQDNGIGIAEADLPHIFDRFYRVQADRSRNTGGTGLGLAIVHAIVQAHHGSIQVDSQLNLGSRFTVSLPIKVTPSKISNQNKIV